MKQLYFIICISLVTLLLGKSQNQKPIDRFSLVNRHNVIVDKVDPFSPLTVGNGDFAFTADVTGFQTFGDHYYTNGIPLESLSSWAWHSFPNTENYKLEDAMKENDFHGRKIMYASLEKSPAGVYFRMNPHPIPLGQISLVDETGKYIDIASISDIHQKLNIWQGVITSRYKIDKQSVIVETVSHPSRSLVAFKIKSSLIKSGKLRPMLRFPYSYNHTVKNKPPFDWSKPDKHQTKIVNQTQNSVTLRRNIDTSAYYVNIQWLSQGKLECIESHKYTLNGTGSDSLLFVCDFSQVASQSDLPGFENTRDASEASWKEYWTKGGAIDLSGSKDSRALELERRIVLSQYLVKVNYAGSFPPQETGLTNISWYGKHNSEMYWWHAAQFYQFNHTELLEKGLQWYLNILPQAKDDAKSKGFDGVRWPKMAGIDGRPTPGNINPFIIWNQPNPIYLAELVYRAHPGSLTLNKYKDLVFESAKFLASYAFYDAKTDRYILGPPVKSVTESNIENQTQNPSFELVFWYYGLKVAQDWRERLGMQREPLWDEIMKKLARPTVVEGKYVELETEPDMYAQKGGVSSAPIMALGYLPLTPMVDKSIMEKTFQTIIERNGIKSFTSWGMGKGALTGARLGDQKSAVDILCNNSEQARFLNNGLVKRPKEPKGCPAYLPVNVSFLAAVALMAAGWDGAPEIDAPGFPQDGSWQVKYENLNKLP